jgi:hypothetical protein
MKNKIAFTKAKAIRSIFYLVAMLSIFAWEPGPYAQKTGLPLGDEIMAKYIAGTGGIAAYDKINNRITWSTLDVRDKNVKIAITTYAAKPNKILIIMDIPGVGQVARGMSEGVVWERTPKGPQIKTGDEMKEGLRDAAFDKFAYWRNSFDSVKCTGIDTVDGHPCDIAVMTPRVGDPLTVHFGRTDGIIWQIDFAIVPKSGPQSVSLIMSDYGKIDGILIPFATRLQMMDGERIMTIDSLRQNVDIPDSLFALPADIRSLMDIKK